MEFVRQKYTREKKSSRYEHFYRQIYLFTNVCNKS